MARISKYIMRVALLLMLFQFFAPAFLPQVVQQVPHNKITSISVPHNSIVAPLLLKEKDEKEHEAFTSISSLAPLLDLAVHSFNLTASHTEKPNYSHQELWYDLEPPLHTRLRTFLI